MATYLELYTQRNQQQLLEKVTVAVVVAADAIRTEDAGTTNHANRVKWAKEALDNPVRMAERVIWLVLAANKTATMQQINDASDSAIQTAVNAVVNVLAQG